MNYNPGVSDQRASLIMQGNEMSQRSGQLAMQLLSYMQDRSDRKNAAIGQLNAMGEGDDDEGASTTPAAGAGGGFNPMVSGGSGDPGNEVTNPALDAAELDGKKAHSIRTLLSNYTEDPQQRTALKAKSLGELEGMLKGYSVKAAMQEHAARMADFNAQAQLRTQQAQDDQSIGQAMSRYSTMPNVKTDDDEYYATGDQTREPSADERFRYALNGVQGRAVPKLITALSAYNQNQQDAITGRQEIYPGVTVLSTRKGGTTVVEDPRVKNEADLTDKFVQDPVSGARFHTFGKTSQPSGYDPDVSKSQLIPQLDEAGGLVGWSSTDPRGHGTFVPNKGGAFKAARDEDGNVIPGYFKDSQGKMLDVRTVLEKHLGGKSVPTPAPADTTALPMPKRKADAVKGKIYSTPRGLAKWDGQQFIPQ